MADNFLITGYWGEPHITAENDRGINAAMFGTGRFVLPVGEQFRAEYIGNNTIRMYDGKLLDNGAAAGIPAGEYIDLLISNAGQGKKRNDLIVFQYAKDGATLTESGKFVVIQGAETSGTPSDPALTQQDLLSNEATFDQFALYRVPVSGTAVSAPVKVFSVRTMANTDDVATVAQNGSTMIQAVEEKVTTVKADLFDTKVALSMIDDLAREVNSDLQNTKASLQANHNHDNRYYTESEIVTLLTPLYNDTLNAYNLTWYPDRDNALEFEEGRSASLLLAELSEGRNVTIRIKRSDSGLCLKARASLSSLTNNYMIQTWVGEDDIEVHTWRYSSAGSQGLVYSSYSVNATLISAFEDISSVIPDYVIEQVSEPIEFVEGTCVGKWTRACWSSGIVELWGEIDYTVAKSDTFTIPEILDLPISIPTDTPISTMLYGRVDPIDLLDQDPITVWLKGNTITSGNIVSCYVKHPRIVTTDVLRFNVYIRGKQ